MTQASAFLSPLPFRLASIPGNTDVFRHNIKPVVRNIFRLRRKARILCRNPVSCAASPIPSSLPPTVITYVDPETNSTVYVIGCVHGSYLSSAEVELMLSATSPDAVVLELCEPRLMTLQKSARKKRPNEPLSIHLKSRNKRSFRQIAETFHGVPQAILAVALDSVYKLQALSGLDPGIEFIAPICNYPSSLLVCGDAPARDTIHNLYRVFISPLQSLRVTLSTIIAMFYRVVWPPQGGVNFAAVIFDPVRMRELARLVISASILGVVIYFLGNATALAIEASPVASALTSPTTDGLWSVVESILHALMGTYFFVSSLHFLKVLIIDRDYIISNSILDTVKRQSLNRGRPVTVCAVVGLLHVNGILSALREHRNDEPRL